MTTIKPVSARHLLIFIRRRSLRWLVPVLSSERSSLSSRAFVIFSDPALGTMAGLTSAGKISSWPSPWHNLFRGFSGRSRRGRSSLLYRPNRSETADFFFAFLAIVTSSI